MIQETLKIRAILAEVPSVPAASANMLCWDSNRSRTSERWCRLPDCTKVMMNTDDIMNILLDVTNISKDNAKITVLKLLYEYLKI